MTCVGVVGAGTMGIGGAHAFALAGFDVVLVDNSSRALERARAEIAGNARMYGLLDKRIAAVPPDEIVARIKFADDIKALSNVDFVLENVTEKWSVKEDLYRAMDGICGEHCVFAVNTSAIPITRLADVTDRPDRVIGVHLMNPVPLKPLVEVIKGARTTPESIRTVRELMGRLGKKCVVVNDSSGFVTNRVAMLSLNEAILVHQEGVASAEDVDLLFRGCLGHPMGPLETADLIGLDTVCYSLEVLLEHHGDQKFEPAPLLRELVAEGRLGRKSGRGFYSYDPA